MKAISHYSDRQELENLPLSTLVSGLSRFYDVGNDCNAFKQELEKFLVSALLSDLGDHP